VIRVILIGCLAVLAFGCASQKAQEVKEVPWTGDSGLAPPSLQQPDAATARESDVSPIPPPAAAVAPAPPATPPGDTAPAKTELLGEISDSTPGAANITRGPCDLENCGVVLAIGNYQAAESVDQDDGEPGLYMPQGMYSAETAGQPEVVDSYGVQKIVQLWNVSVQMRDGTMHVIQQRSEPLFRVGDSVLVNGNNILLWN
jgi:hypothetical protein